MSEENLEIASTEGSVAPVNSEASAPEADTNVNDTVKPEGSEQEIAAETPVEPETVTKTKKELDDEFARVRQIAERKARVKAERELQERYRQQQAQQQPAPQPVNTYWDDGLQRNIPGNMSIEEYARLTSGQPTNQSIQQPQQHVQMQQQPVQHQQEKASVPSEKFSMGADMQAIECDVDFSDFQKVLRESSPSVTMLNAVAQDDNGVKNLYLKLKEDPSFALKISRLSPQDQQHRMWQLNQEMSNKTQKRVVTKATPQPAAINAGTNVRVSEEEMSISELRRLRRKQEEDRRRR